MSRSKRKSPIIGNLAPESEKQAKRKANRVVRHANKQSPNDEDAVIIHKRERSNIMKFGKDGKQYLKDPDPKLMRK